MMGLDAGVSYGSARSSGSAPVWSLLDEGELTARSTSARCSLPHTHSGINAAASVSPNGVIVIHHRRYSLVVAPGEYARRDRLAQLLDQHLLADTGHPPFQLAEPSGTALER